MRAIDWIPEPDPGHIRLVEQTLLPDTVTHLDVHDVPALIDAIRRLAVRGAPALGVAGAMGVALAARTVPAGDVPGLVTRLRSARPTAVNLARGVDRACRALSTGGPDAALRAALALRDEDIAACTAMARHGTRTLAELAPGVDRLTVLTICNTGALATVEHGTALGVIERLHAEGRLERALVCETRPLLQGARLTTWELQRMGAPFDLIVDAAAASLLAAGGVHAVLVGADRIAANGDTANKIGTLALALAARYAAVPFLVVAPSSTVDVGTASGALIDVEERDGEEVCTVRGVRIAPRGTTARNPAFDVTPAELVTAIVTELGVIDLASGRTPDRFLDAADGPPPDPSDLPAPTAGGAR